MRVLVVDDDPLVIRSLRRLLAGHHEVVSAADVMDATAKMHSAAPIGAVICDLDLRDVAPDIDGRWFLGFVRERWPETRRVLISGHPVGPVGEAHAVLPKVEIDRAMLLAALAG